MTARIEPLRTGRLTLEPLRTSHAREMVSVLADPTLYEFTGGEAPTEAELEDRYRAQRSGPRTPGERWFNWIVRTSADRSAIGFVQASVVGARADVAWLIGVDHQGHGYATEATRAMVAWLAGKGVEQFDAHIHPDHDTSQRVARSVGLMRSGGTDEDGEEIWSAPGNSMEAPGW